MKASNKRKRLEARQRDWEKVGALTTNKDREGPNAKRTYYRKPGSLNK